MKEAINLKIKKRYNSKKEWVPMGSRQPRNNQKVVVLYADGEILESVCIHNKQGKFSFFFSEKNRHPLYNFGYRPAPLMWRHHSFIGEQ